MQIVNVKALPLQETPNLEAGTPLWKLVPTRDEDGRPISDFMMLIPGLARQSARVIEDTLKRIHGILAYYSDVVFANFNMRLNLLWVSVRNRPGITLEVATAIKVSVPEALLVAPKFRR